MPERSTLEYVADLIIQRTIASVSPEDLEAALQRAYPFGDDPVGYRVWVEALKRNGIKGSVPKPPSLRPKPSSAAAPANHAEAGDSSSS